jgi:hypothetical protein
MYVCRTEKGEGVYTYCHKFYEFSQLVYMRFTVHYTSPSIGVQKAQNSVTVSTVLTRVEVAPF